MTREAFIRKWLGNHEKPYTQANRDEMRDDLDKVIENSLKPYPKMKKVYEFLYNPSVSESAPLTVSIHESESGAIQAMEAHRHEIWEDWNEEKKHNPEDVDYPWDFDQWWGVKESELLP